jgi:hypothetical protein
MFQQTHLSARIAQWTREAFEIWGQDWPRISAYIEQRMVSLEPGEKRDVALEAALTLVDAGMEPRH